jgi:PST family polysaccharide transporter
MTTKDIPAFADQRSPLKGSVLAASGAAGIAINLMKATLQVLTLPIMASLLTPADFGLYALAQPIVGFGWMLADAGFGASLAREPESNTDMWSTAWWFLLGLGIVLAASMCAAGMVIGSVTQQPRLPGLVGLMSVAVIGVTLGTVPSARLDRRGRLLMGPGSELAAMVAGFVAAIGFALAGAGVFSLAAQFVSVAAVRAVVLNLAAFRLPTRRFRPNLLRTHLSTGGAQITLRLLDLCDRLASNAVLQRTIGIESLGYYGFGTQISRFITESVSNPCWLLLYLQAVRDDTAKTRRLHVRTCRVLGLLLLPASMIGAAAAPGLVGAVLGSRWLAASEVIQLTLPFFALSTISAQSGPLLLACGRYSIVLRTQGIGAALRLAFAAAGGWIGLRGIAIGLDASLLLQSVILLLGTRGNCGIALRPVLVQLVGPAVAGVCAVAAFLALSSALATNVWDLVVSCAGAGLAAGLCLLAVDRAHLAEDLAMLRRLVFKCRPTAAATPQPEPI